MGYDVGYEQCSGPGPRSAWACHTRRLSGLSPRSTGIHLLLHYGLRAEPGPLRDRGGLDNNYLSLQGCHELLADRGRRDAGSLASRWRTLGRAPTTLPCGITGTPSSADADGAWGGGGGVEGQSHRRVHDRRHVPLQRGEARWGCAWWAGRSRPTIPEIPQRRASLYASTRPKTAATSPLGGWVRPVPEAHSCRPRGSCTISPGSCSPIVNGRSEGPGHGGHPFAGPVLTRCAGVQARSTAALSRV
jgi:hypothetical protein